MVCEATISTSNAIKRSRSSGSPQATTCWWNSPRREHYFPAADIPFHIELGETKSIDVVNERRSTIIVHKVDPDGHPVLGTCFDVVAVESTVPPGTSVGSGAILRDVSDGTITIRRAGHWTYSLVETNVPFGYLKAEELTFTIVGGETKEFTVVTRGPGMLNVHKVDEAGAPLSARASSSTATPAMAPGELVGCRM